MTRGEIYLADLNPVVGCEQGGIRPVLVVQNNVGNTYSPTVIAAAITSKNTKKPLPTHINIKHRDGLPRNSTILLEQVRTLDKTRLIQKLCSLSEKEMDDVNRALHVSFAL